MRCRTWGPLRFRLGCNSIDDTTPPVVMAHGSEAELPTVDEGFCLSQGRDASARARPTPLQIVPRNVLYSSGGQRPGSDRSAPLLSASGERAAPADSHRRSLGGHPRLTHPIPYQRHSSNNSDFAASLMMRSAVQSNDGMSVAEPGSQGRRHVPSVTLDLYASHRPDRGSILTSRMCDQHLMGTYHNISPPPTVPPCQEQGHQPQQQGADGASSGDEYDEVADMQPHKGIPNKAIGASPESPTLCVDIWQQLKLQGKVGRSVCGA